ncbi:MAG: hypothetical protein IIC88_06710, partial [Chloroflexi bacterium]|nr:hypothetical protein [Chloroflexota bacterium]
DIDDLRQSPALRIIELLEREGADVLCHDPFHDTPPLDAVIEDADAVVLATNHSAFRELQPAEMRKKTKPDCIFVDCWGQWDEPGEGGRILTFGKGDAT